MEKTKQNKPHFSDTMEIGDSFLYPVSERGKMTTRLLRIAKGKKFKSLTIDDKNVRFWRIK